MAQIALRTFLPTRVAAPSANRLLLRAGLLAGAAISVGLAAWWGDPSGYLQADPALARLLRGMALIKSLIAMAAVGAVWWRFGSPLSRAAACGYAVTSWTIAGSTMLIWELSAIPLAALLFHAALLGMVMIGWRAGRAR